MSAILARMNPFQLLNKDSPTPLLTLPGLAAELGVANILAKAENLRPLGNFKSLGGIHAARLALSRLDALPSGGGINRILICASDGNHGLSVAAAAHEAGIGARIYLPRQVPINRAERITRMGATIAWVEGTYDSAVTQARYAAARGEGILIADTTDDPDDVVVSDVMTGYEVIATEILTQIEAAALPSPTHLFAQAGVGGFAAAMAQGLVDAMAPPQQVVVVEPASAACVAAGLAHGRPVQISGSLHTCADMLSCGAASAPALSILLRHQALAIQVGESALRDACDITEQSGGPPTTPSGAAGLAGLIATCRSSDERSRVGLNERSVVLIFVTEGRH